MILKWHGLKDRESDILVKKVKAQASKYSKKIKWFVNLYDLYYLPISKDYYTVTSG